MADSKLFHIGLRREHSEIMAPDGKGLPCPCQYLVVGGLTFHLYTHKVEGFGAETVRHRVQGGYAWIPDEQIKRINADLDVMRVQWIGRHPDGTPIIVTDEVENMRAARARIVDTRARGYRPVAGELSLHGWIYMQESAAGPELYDQPEPASIVAAAAAEPDTEADVAAALRKGSSRR